MTMPPCTHGVTVLGNCPKPLRICVSPGELLSDAIQYQDPQTGLPLDWPAGMTAFLRVESGAFIDEYPLTVDGSYLRILVLPADTLLWPRRACVSVWLQFNGQPGPVKWLEGSLDGGCC